MKTSIFDIAHFTQTWVHTYIHTHTHKHTLTQTCTHTHTHRVRDTKLNLLTFGT